MGNLPCFDRCQFYFREAMLYNSKIQFYITLADLSKMDWLWHPPKTPRIPQLKRWKGPWDVN